MASVDVPPMLYASPNMRRIQWPVAATKIPQGMQTRAMTFAERRRREARSEPSYEPSAKKDSRHSPAQGEQQVGDLVGNEVEGRLARPPNVQDDERNDERRAEGEEIRPVVGGRVVPRSPQDAGGHSQSWVCSRRSAS